MPTLIAAFEVPPDADEAFVAGWEPASPAATLYRALRADVDFRFVEIGEGAAPAGGGGSFPAHRGAYEVVREDATPDVEGGVVLVNPFEVPAEDDDKFLAGWDDARGALADQRGYLGTRLHRAIDAADFRFVNVARWSSPLMFARALQRPEFQRAAEALPFPAHPALYQVVRAA
jgi:heme oxygenase (mycobilin-producing)